MGRLIITPISFDEANRFVQRHHRHHGKVAGMKFAIGVSNGESIVGVALVGRPVARHLDNGWTLEVNRCCTDGTKNACSILYGAAWRAARALGYTRLITYTLKTESGSSLKASGYRIVGEVKGRQWSCPSRQRVRKDVQDRLLWEA